LPMVVPAVIWLAAATRPVMSALVLMFPAISVLPFASTVPKATRLYALAIPKGIDEAWQTPAKNDKLAKTRRNFLKNMPSYEAVCMPNENTCNMAYFSELGRNVTEMWARVFPKCKILPLMYLR